MPEGTSIQRMAAKAADLRAAFEHGSNDEEHDAATELVDVVEEFLAEHGGSDDTVRRVYSIEPYGSLEVKLTYEGVIIDGFDKDAEVVATRAHMAEELFLDLIVEHELRTCDECGRIEDAGGQYDWVNGVCQDCDPEVLNDPENVKRRKFAETGEWDD